MAASIVQPTWACQAMLFPFLIRHLTVCQASSYTAQFGHNHCTEAAPALWVSNQKPLFSSPSEILQNLTALKRRINMVFFISWLNVSMSSFTRFGGTKPNYKLQNYIRGGFNRHWLRLSVWFCAVKSFILHSRLIHDELCTEAGAGVFSRKTPHPYKRIHEDANCFSFIWFLSFVVFWCNLMSLCSCFEYLWVSLFFLSVFQWGNVLSLSAVFFAVIRILFCYSSCIFIVVCVFLCSVSPKLLKWMFGWRWNISTWNLFVANCLFSPVLIFVVCLDRFCCFHHFLHLWTAAPGSCCSAERLQSVDSCCTWCSPTDGLAVGRSALETTCLDLFLIVHLGAEILSNPYLIFSRLWAHRAPQQKKKVIIFDKLARGRVVMLTPT